MMRKRAISLVMAFIMVLSSLVCTVPVSADNGVLDGLDEAVLVARYLFDGDTDDWSRNGYNATLYKGSTGTQAAFVEDSIFGTVLSLPGGSNGNYVRIPGEALIDVSSVSVTGWVYAKSNTNYQRFFDFGQNSTRNFYSCPNTTYRSRITTTGSAGEVGNSAANTPRNQWVHLATVLDTDSKTMKIYSDGVMVAQTNNVNMTMRDIVSQTNAAANLLYIGKSQYSDPNLNGNLHDVRVYNVALTDAQVATIRNNAITDEVKVNSDLAAISLGNLANRTTNLTLPVSGASGTTIAWDSDHPEFVSTTGVVTRPPNTYEQESATVVLTATGTLNGASAARTFTVTVPRLPSDQDVVTSDAAAINLGDISAVKANITLPTTGSIGASINWASDKPEVISTEGVVTRPAPGAGNATVTLTATISYGAASTTKTFTATVVAMPTDQDTVDMDVAAINLGDLNTVVGNLTLPTTGASGLSTLSWTSSNEAVISTAGVVTRPSYEQGNQTVTLTVTATMGSNVATKSFTATVIRISSAPVLTGVPDIEVETVVGTLPHLPFYIPGQYQDGGTGPLVRVNWPAPTNNNQVLSTGTYTMTGTVPGTAFTPTATVTVKKETEGVNVIYKNSEFFNIAAGFKYGSRIAPRLENDKVLTASIKADNITEESLDTTMIVALYDSANRMVSESHTSKSVNAGENGSLSADITLPGDVGGYKVRVFVWKGMTLEEAINPLSGVVEINSSGVDYDFEAPEITLEAFSLGKVILNKQTDGSDTQFIKNRDKFITGLLNTKPDSFLYMFRNAFGETQPAGATALGGWDTQTTKLRGHATGHYLSALAQAYASASYDPNIQANLKQKMDYMVDTLYDLSQKSGKPAVEGGPYNASAKTVPYGPGKSGYDSDFSVSGVRTDYWNWGEGFISAYAPDQFIMLENGATYGSSNAQIWAPYYTLHKILTGLVDCYELGGEEKALTVAKGMGLWVYNRIKDIPDSQFLSMWDRYIAGEYGGMNEIMAKLYQLSGDDRYLITADKFDNISLFYGNLQKSGGLARNVDTFRGHHANQHIPQIVGALKQYDATKDIKYYDIAANFWNISYNSYTYSIGGVAGSTSNSENYTAQPNSLFTLGFNTGGQNETCATYNLLKLSRQLYMHDQDTKYMDYYEQALYNDILSSVAENNAGNTYHIPLNPGAVKGFGNSGMNGFTCCNGTALESNTKLQDSIYFKSVDNKALYVNLYVPSTLNWTERNVTVTQDTNFPYADSTKLKITGGGNFDIKVRVPKWATKGFIVSINGEEQAVAATPGTYLTLNRTWADGDTIDLKMPFHFYLSPLMDKPNIASIFYGPVLLAVQESGTLSTWRKMNLDAGDIGASITGDPSTLTFTTNGVTLKPFYLTYGRHSVYVDVTLQ